MGNISENSNLTNLLDNILSIFNKKYGVKIVEAKFTPEIKLRLDSKPLPTKKGSGKGEQQNGYYWDSPMWATADAVDSRQRIFPKKFKKKLSENDAKLLLDIVSKVKGDMNLYKDIEKVFPLYKSLYEDENTHNDKVRHLIKEEKVHKNISELKRSIKELKERLKYPYKKPLKSPSESDEDYASREKELKEKYDALPKQIKDLEKKLDQENNILKKLEQSKENTEFGRLTQEIRNFWKKLENKYQEPIKSRENALRELKQKAFFNDDIATKVKSTFLRFSTPEKIMKQIRRMMEEEVKEEPKEKIQPPKKDPNKDRFSINDRKWIVNYISQNRDKGGTKEVINTMRKYFNNNLINEAIMAAQHYGFDLKKFQDYFKDYDRKRSDVEKAFRNEITLDDDTTKEEITQATSNIKKFLKGIKSKYKDKYKGSLFDKTEKLVNLIQKFNLSKNPSPEVATALLEAFYKEVEEEPLFFMDTIKEENSDGTSRDQEDDETKKVPKSIGSAWRRLKTPVKKDIQNLQILLSEWSRNKHKDLPSLKNVKDDNDYTKELSKKQKEELSKSDLGKEINNFIQTYIDNKPLGDLSKEKEIRKDMNKEKNKKLKELKNTNKNKTFNFALSNLSEYLERIIKNTPDEGDRQLSLYPRTKHLVDIIRSYSHGSLQKDLSEDLVTATKRAYDTWKNLDRVDPTVKKYLAKLKTSIKDALVKKSPEIAQRKIDEKLVNAIKQLAKSSFYANKHDLAVIEAYNPSKIKKDKNNKIKYVHPDNYNKKSSSKIIQTMGGLRLVASQVPSIAIQDELRDIYIKLSEIL